jgi:hypothetical protein
VSDPIVQLNDAIDRARHGDPEATVGLRNVIRTVADEWQRSYIVMLAEALLAVRNEIVRREAESN